jgi:hypothetical protein
MALVLAGCLAGLTYLIKDYFDGQERSHLYARIATARADERARATADEDKRIADLRSYYASLSKERDARLEQLASQNEDLLNLNRQALTLIQAGREDRRKSLAVATVAANKATQAVAVADTTNKALNTLVNKEQIPETTVKNLNARIKDVNRK